MLTLAGRLRDTRVNRVSHKAMPNTEGVGGLRIAPRCQGASVKQYWQCKLAVGPECRQLALESPGFPPAHLGTAVCFLPCLRVINYSRVNYSYLPAPEPLSRALVVVRRKLCGTEKHRSC